MKPEDKGHTKTPGQAGMPPEVEGNGGKVPRLWTRRSIEGTDPLNADLPSGILDKLDAARRPRPGQLTQLKAPELDSLDPLVRKAIERATTKFSDAARSARSELAVKYFTIAESVTDSLNRQPLAQLTRALLSSKGAYEVLLLKAIKEHLEAPNDPHAQPGRPSTVS